MNFSKAIRIIRAQKGLSQQAFAKKTEIDPSLISRIETGERKPSKKTLQSISKYTNIPMELITLLATEEKDHQKIPQEKMEALGLDLLRLLIYE